MKIEANSPDKYVEKVPEERRASFKRLPPNGDRPFACGFEEVMAARNDRLRKAPHSLQPDGYHLHARLAAAVHGYFANQKNFIAFLTAMGIYAEPELLEWFLSEYKALNLRKLDMGKSCMRFKKCEEIPFELIGELVAKRSPQDWIAVYESQFKKKK